MDPEILEDYAKYWAKYGDSTIAIGMLRRESKAWEKQFGFLRRDDGTLIMSEKDAISNIYSYKSTLLNMILKIHLCLIKNLKT